MNRVTKCNLHVPLPADLYRRLREEAVRLGRPATEIARGALDQWLAAAERRAIDDDIGAYATEHAGTAADLDPSLEEASIEHLAAPGRRRRQKR